MSSGAAPAGVHARPGRDPRRRQQLLEAADRVVAREGTATTMAAVAAEAGVTKPVLYRHFGDKSGLYGALAEQHTGRLLQELSGSLAVPGRRARLTATVDRYLELVAESPQVYRFLTRGGEAATDPGVQQEVATFLGRLTALLARGIAAETGLAADDPRAAVWAHGLVGAVRTAGDWWLEDPRLTRAELAEALTRLVAGEYLASSAGAGVPGP